jgi:hypothetical protein
VTHPRQQIRDAAIALLDAVPGLTGRVEGMRTRATVDDELPVVLVYSTRETSTRETVKRGLMRVATLAIEIRVKAAGDIGAAVDALCAEVEAAMESDPGLSRKARDSVLAATTIGLDGEGDHRQAVATLEYQVTYRTTPAA